MTSTIKVNNIQNQCGQNIINENSNTITLGASGDTIALASGASQTGFGRTGTVDWQTGSIKTGTFTAANGEGYFADTSSGTFVMNLPAGSAGAIVSVVDYTNTFQTNFLTVTPNGSEKIGGVAASVNLSTQGQSVTLVYVDGNEGWKNVQDSTSNVTGTSFITATGGAITECGNFRIHTFTGTSSFNVTALATVPTNNVVDYLVVAGGGSGGARDPGNANGGGGAGGFRFHSCQTNFPTATAPAHTKNGPAGLPVSVQNYPITVGAGGASVGPAPGGVVGNNGSNSTFSSITSAGGGSGGAGAGGKEAGGNGGSGGGAGGGQPGGSPIALGDTPPVSPAQGSNGGQGGNVSPDQGAGGGGGAMAAGTNKNATPTNGPGGAGGGLPSGFGANGVPCGSFRYYAGGGGAGVSPDYAAGTGGLGGGGTTSTAGTANTGGGGGGNNAGSTSTSGAGGSGIVVIRYRFQ
jgi:hypothetical protein